MEQPTSQPTINLTDQPTRQLTDREMAQLLTGFVGTLANFGTIETIRRAMNWVMMNDAFWAMCEKQQDAIKAVTDHLIEQELLKGRQM